MISNYNLDCGYHDFELKDKIYLVPDWALKVIYTDGFNEVVYQGDSSNVTILEGHEITFQEETLFDERFKFSKTLSINVEGYVTFSDLYNRYYAIIETKDSEFYIVNVDFPSFVTHTYTLNNGTNSTELVFSSQSNIATLKLTNFESTNVNPCKKYTTSKIKNVKLTETWASSLSTWKKSLVNKGEFVNIEPLPDSINLTEEFDGEKYTVTLGFDIPMRHFKNDWHIKLLQFEENKYRGYISLEDGNKAFVGYNVGLFPSYTINGDIISIRLTEVAIRGIAYGNDYVLIDTDIPNTIEYNGASCYTYNWFSTCDWNVESKPEYITISPMAGNSDTQYTLQVCNTDDETGYAVSEFIIKACNERVRPQVIVKNPLYRWVNTEETVCVLGSITRTTSGAPYCINCDKYVDVTTEISYDSGETWQFDSSASTLVEADSDFCKEYRTIQTGESYCYGGDEWIITELQARCNGGEWFFVSSAETLINDDSDKCTYYLTFKPLENCTFRFKKSSNNIYMPEYSKNHGTWIRLQDFNETVSATTGDEIRWRSEIISESNSNINSFNVGQFYSTGRFNAEGYATSMIYGKKHLEVTEAPDYGFADMFNGNTGLTDASEIVLSSYAYAYEQFVRMFADCTSLIAAPDLSSFTGAAANSFYAMFSGCTSLVNSPNMPSISAIHISTYSYMFAGCTSLENVYDLSASTINSYGCSHMFEGCTSLETAPNILANGIASGGCLNMFAGCTSLVTGPSSIGRNANAAIMENTCKRMFSGCTSLELAPELPATTLHDSCYYQMFEGCTSLKESPILPAKNLVNTCYYAMFNGCSNLNKITCLATHWNNSSHPTDYWVSGVNLNSGLFIKDFSFEWTYDNDDAVPVRWGIRDYGVFEGKYVIKLSNEWSQVTFASGVCDSTSSVTNSDISTYSTSAISAIIGDCVTNIGANAFSGFTSLSSIIIPANVTSINSGAFSGCTNLTNIYVDGVTPPTLGSNVFRNEDDYFIYVPSESVNTYKTASGWNAYASKIQPLPPYYNPKITLTLDDMSEVEFGCNLKQVLSYNDLKDYASTCTDAIVGNCVREVGNSAFDDYLTLTGVTIPNNVTKIGGASFSGCANITNITIPSGVTSIGNYAFAGCSSLRSINIPNGVTSLGDEIFSSCYSLSSITIPNSVTNIGAGTFVACWGLRNVVIPSGVTSIGQGAFSNCSGLTGVTIEAITPPTIGMNVFENTNNCYIYVPCESVGDYKIASGWSDYKSRIKGIPPCVIYPKVTLTLNDSSVIDIDCDSSSAITSGEVSNQYSSSVVNAVVGNCVAEIGDFSFYNCNLLTAVTIPNNVTSIGVQAFNVCSSLSSITIPNSVTSIGQSAFNSCSVLTSITIPNSVTTIGNDAFAWCGSLTSVKIGSGITSIGEWAFIDCTGVTSVTINAITPPTIGEYAFETGNNCPIYVPSGSVNTYKSASGWSTYSSRIQAIT